MNLQSNIRVYNENMNTVTQYAGYLRPDWAPPSWVFGPVWTILYIVIAGTFGYVTYQYLKGKIGFSVLLPFLLNLFFNFSFTYIQFGLMNLKLAALDILLVLGTLLWAMSNVWKRYRWVALANIPYLAWVAFATALQLTITYLNS
jgi:tryptophan-rich sensory protein